MLLFPVRNSPHQNLKKEKELKNNTSISVNLHLKSVHDNAGDNLNAKKKNLGTPDSLNLVLPPDAFTEESLQLEDWMKNPKKWNKN
jgi:hypothetical protein